MFGKKPLIDMFKLTIAFGNGDRISVSYKTEDDRNREYFKLQKMFEENEKLPRIINLYDNDISVIVEHIKYFTRSNTKETEG
jgi:endonuclease III-like uncharacterized protein